MKVMECPHRSRSHSAADIHRDGANENLFEAIFSITASKSGIQASVQPFTVQLVHFDIVQRFPMSIELNTLSDHFQ